jgi:hypothetical protein
MAVDLVYVNQTDSSISFQILENIGLNNISTITLDPFSTSKIFTYEYDGVDKKITPQSCCNSFLRNVYDINDINGSGKKIVLNDSLCVFHLNNKSTIISNYNSEVISDRHFRYTYTFTFKDFKDAKKCL